MTNLLVTSLVVVVAVAVLDGLWISANFRMYNGMYTRIQGSDMQVNMVGAALSYVFIFVAFMFIVLPRLKQTKGTFIDCLREGGLVGLCIYAVYNFTNMATFKNYSLTVALMDTFWGATLFTILAYVTTFLK
jgi:uncharacterized membrane protein